MLGMLKTILKTVLKYEKNTITLYGTCWNWVADFVFLVRFCTSNWSETYLYFVRYRIHSELRYICMFTIVNVWIGNAQWCVFFLIKVNAKINTEWMHCAVANTKALKWIDCRPQMKLREGNVFTGVCLSFCSGGPVHDHGTHYPPTTDIWWSSLETCSNLYTWELIRISNRYWHLVDWSPKADGTYPTRILPCIRFMFSVMTDVSTWAAGWSTKQSWILHLVQMDSRLCANSFYFSSEENCEFF